MMPKHRIAKNLISARPPHSRASRAQEIVMLESVAILGVTVFGHIAKGGFGTKKEQGDLGAQSQHLVRSIAASAVLAAGLTGLAMVDGETAVALGGLALAAVTLTTLGGKSIGELALAQGKKFGQTPLPASGGPSLTTALANISTANFGGGIPSIAPAGPLNPLTPSVGSGKGAQAYQAMTRYLGTLYSWGGGGKNGPSLGIGQGANTVGFDCSGLTEYGWDTVGVEIGRTTFAQINVGVAVDSTNPAAWQIGDLLFPNLGHVQCKGPGNTCIEAPHTGGKVQIVQCNSSYWKVRRPG